LEATIEIIDLGLLYYYLGFEVWQMKESIFISQAKYVKEFLKRFEMKGCKLPIEMVLKLSIDED
jgi:hypothetical protein